ncbi:hypothetical protein [Stenotrophomonas sp.]|uniref:hypothetical protein n=1 Tax=Stenotrophomonas sp. TaxID=69392 RepID=UPI0028A678E4|nr:hypothetical protein [Stenotrophomonas sp.]
MNLKHGRHALHALVTSSALLMLGCSASLGTAHTDARDYAAELAGDEQDANDSPKAKQPARRMRTSLSLPYFSFAPSLNPRS